MQIQKNRCKLELLDRYETELSEHFDSICLAHNDLCFIESLCKKRNKVAYIADGIYSMGGIADIEGLLYLKKRYGLFIYLDDSHALSAFGERGKGFIRPYYEPLDDQTIIVASLGKAFGASGGLIMFGSENQKTLMSQYGGPSNWSQSLNSAAIGAGLASIKIHSAQQYNNPQHIHL